MFTDSQIRYTPKGETCVLLHLRACDRPMSLPLCGDLRLLCRVRNLSRNSASRARAAPIAEPRPDPKIVPPANLWQRPRQRSELPMQGGGVLQQAVNGGGKSIASIADCFVFF